MTDYSAGKNTCSAGFSWEKSSLRCMHFGLRCIEILQRKFNLGHCTSQEASSKNLLDVNRKCLREALLSFAEKPKP